MIIVFQNFFLLMFCNLNAVNETESMSEQAKIDQLTNSKQEKIRDQLQKLHFPIFCAALTYEQIFFSGFELRKTMEKLEQKKREAKNLFSKKREAKNLLSKTKLEASKKKNELEIVQLCLECFKTSLNLNNLNTLKVEKDKKLRLKKKLKKILKKERIIVKNLKKIIRNIYEAKKELCDLQEELKLKEQEKKE